MLRMRSRRVIAGTAAALVVGSGAYALTASNTVPGSSAGVGSSAISGYTASNIHYNLNATTPDDIDSVTFTLNATAATVKIKVTSGGGYYSCANQGGNDWSCATTSPQATAGGVDDLTVLAAQ